VTVVRSYLVDRQSCTVQEIDRFVLGRR
jgi:hypothetical protein